MASNSDDEESVLQFHEMGLDDRLLMAITKLRWKEPTLIQEKAIPLALQGKDVLARARTGTGKTACVLIPVINKLLQIKTEVSEQQTLVLFLAPSKELCHQAEQHLKELTSSCSLKITSINISMKDTTDKQTSGLKENPDVVFSTPSRARFHIKQGDLDLEDVTMVIIDEADLIFSSGYEKSMVALRSHFPKIYQGFLMSATLDDNVMSMKKLVLHNAVTLKLEESSLPSPKQLTQYYAKFQGNDKYLLLFGLLKLNLLEGKCLIFVKNVDRCYKIKLFLSHLDIKACVLNTELPANSRVQILRRFNHGDFRIIIAADQSGLTRKQLRAGGCERDKSEASSEYSVARGIDFQSVGNVINFDLPYTTDAYIHRVGRTARGKSQGTSLTFVSYGNREKFNKIKSDIESEYAPGVEVWKEFQFDLSEIEGLRYRTIEALRGTGRVSVWAARKDQIRLEVMSSERLKTYFEENPRERQVLYDQKCRPPRKVAESLKYIPEYAIPEKLKERHEEINQVIIRREQIKKKRFDKKLEIKEKRKQDRMSDPLDSLTLDTDSANSKFKKKRRKDQH